MPTYQLDIMEPSTHITPITPSSCFFSLALKRPGLNKIPSLLGISCHPLGIVSDPSQSKYAALQNEQSGDFYWKAGISALTVYVNREAKPVWLTSASASGGPIGQPTAVVDSGMPIILATPDIMNGIYGALGIGPGSDGQYYVNCTTPINMTITLDNHPEIPLHPLDLTTAFALDDFNTIRVLKQPLGTGNSANSGAQGGKSAMDALSGKKISIGIAALIGLLGFFALCFVLFTARWAYARRRYRCERALGGGPNDSGDLKTDDQLIQDVAYRLARRSSRSNLYGSSEDTLRAVRYSEYK
ncbi:hypothetical protein QCA50_012592 [Cerrena zonata]|uniref:Peptidase A1 domain-containing protein n=1 Tax=Cerrena zonata TaxID=2478898 RepID=A0AAW0FT92_9APHY